MLNDPFSNFPHTYLRNRIGNIPIDSSGRVSKAKRISRSGMGVQGPPDVVLDHDIVSSALRSRGTGHGQLGMGEGCSDICP
jgi:hypothetical protein